MRNIRVFPNSWRLGRGPEDLPILRTFGELRNPKGAASTVDSSVWDNGSLTSMAAESNFFTSYLT